MPTHMPPVPPANRSKNDHRSDLGKEVSNDKLVKHEHHANAAEKGETANIRQKTRTRVLSRPTVQLILRLVAAAKLLTLEIERPICKSHCK